MWVTNLKVIAVALVVVGFYTLIAHIIPQLQSEVPEPVALGANATPEQLVSAGGKVFEQICTACHGLGTRAPNLRTDFRGEGPIGQRCAAAFGARCKDYLHTSLVKPHDSLVPGFGPIMPDMTTQLSNDQIWAVVAYLESQGGDVTVTSDDIQRTAGSAATAGAAAGAAGGAAGVAAGSTDPNVLINNLGCLACHSLNGQGQHVGPPFDGMGTRLKADYIRRSILFPNADTAKGYAQFAGVMPTNFGERLSATQLEALVEFLASRK